MRPDFIGIGPGKSGTTWMYRILNEHPDTGLAASKETLFFSTEYHRGTDWYLNLFKHCQDRKAVGEVSNSYIYDPEAAVRIHAFDPTMKLISCLRNPVDRTFSDYLFLIRNNQVSGSFEEVIHQQPEMLSKSRYARLLTPFLDLFPRRQLLIFLFDDLRNQPAEIARRIYRFIGVNETFEPPSLLQKAMPASRPRNRLVAGLIKRTAVMVRNAGRPEIVHRLKESRLTRYLYRPLSKEEYPRLSAATRNSLQDYFRDDTRRLSGMIGRDLEALWFSQPTPESDTATGPGASGR
jgi:hypothetical protein